LPGVTKQHPLRLGASMEIVCVESQNKHRAMGEWKMPEHDNRREKKRRRKKTHSRNEI